MINELAFQANSPLFLEFNNLFQSLFNHSEKHSAIVKTLAKKRRGMVQEALLKSVGLTPSGRSSDILEELSACGFIQAVPI